MNRDIIGQPVDAMLELAVVPSFSRLGPAIRSRLFNWDAEAIPALDGATIAITGPTSGIGRAAAHALAAAGARLILVGRSQEKLDALVDELSSARHDHAPVVADMSSQRSVRAAASLIAGISPTLDVLIDNAGAIYPERVESVDGIESTLAILVCGPFTLVHALLPQLKQGRGRVIAVTSGGMYAQAVDLDDLQWQKRRYNGTAAYAQAKRVQVALIREWARRYRDAGVSFNAMHPGWADTPGLAESLPTFRAVMKPLLRSPEEGADTIAWLAATRSIAPGGKLYLDRRPRPFDKAPQTRLNATDRAELWEEIAGLTGQR